MLHPVFYGVIIVSEMQCFVSLSDRILCVLNYFFLLQMRRVAEFKEKNASLLKDLIPVNEKQILIETNVVNVLVDRDQKGRRILVANVGGKYVLPDTSETFAVVYPCDNEILI